VRADVAYWVPKGNLQDWQIRVVFDLTYKGRAACEARPEYKEAVLTFNLDRCAAEREDMEGCVLHELMHCHTWAQAAATERHCKTDDDWELSRLAEEAATTALMELLLRIFPRRSPQ
jgi:hypothetical protein